VVPHQSLKEPFPEKKSPNKLSNKKLTKSVSRPVKPVKKLGYLLVKSKPPFANVNINKRYMASTPFTSPLGLAAGTYSLSIKKKGWITLQEKILLKAGDTLVFVRELKPLP